MGAFADIKGPKKHNSPKALQAKITLRRNILATVGADRCRVFDAFAGPGEMHRSVWHEAASYVGCDLEWFRDRRRVFVGDNTVVMRAIDLHAFNVFDLDAFGSPWETATILCARRDLRPGEVVGICITDGLGINLRTANVAIALAGLSGVPSGHMRLANRAHDLLSAKAISEMVRRMGGRVAKQWRAVSRVGAAMQYHALVIEGVQASKGS